MWSILVNVPSALGAVGVFHKCQSVNLADDNVHISNILTDFVYFFSVNYVEISNINGFFLFRIIVYPL